MVVSWVYRVIHKAFISAFCGYLFELNGAEINNFINHVLRKHAFWNWIRFTTNQAHPPQTNIER